MFLIFKKKKKRKVIHIYLITSFKTKLLLSVLKIFFQIVYSFLFHLFYIFHKEKKTRKFPEQSNTSKKIILIAESRRKKYVNYKYIKKYFLFFFFPIEKFK